MNVTNAIQVRRLQDIGDREIQGLSDVLIDCVEGGASASFQQVAHFREVGHKFGRWLDLVFVQRFLDAPGAPRAD